MADFLLALLTYAILVAGGMVLGCVFGYALRVVAIALVNTVAYAQNRWRSRD